MGLSASIEAKDAEWKRSVLDRTEQVFGVLGRDPIVRHAWAGLYPGTPDRHPIIDRIADGLFVSLGFAGTGLMHAPGAAVVVSELVMDGTIHSLDAGPLRADRFDGSSKVRVSDG